MGLFDSLVPRDVQRAVGAARAGKQMLDAASTRSSAKKLAAANPPRPGAERLLCYGTIVLIGMDTQTLYPPQSPEDAQGMLAGSWNVTSPETAVQTLSWLRDEGQRGQFAPFIRAAIQSVTQSSLGGTYKALLTRKLDQLANPLADAGFAGGDARAIAAVHRRVKSAREFATGKARAYAKTTITTDQFDATNNIDAWDIERIGNVARFSFTAGYLSEDETYQWLGVADQMATGRYPNWIAYGLSYILGRALCYDGDIDDIAVETFQRMSFDANHSPWQKYPLH